MKRVIFPIGILAGGIFFAAVLLRSPTVVEEAAPEVIPVSVRVAQVRAESIQLNVESQGKVQASQVASLSAPVAGPVAWISSAMEAGGFVKEGESLLRLESSDYETARARSLAAMQQAGREGWAQADQRCLAIQCREQGCTRHSHADPGQAASGEHVHPVVRAAAGGPGARGAASPRSSSPAP